LYKERWVTNPSRIKNEYEHEGINDDFNSSFAYSNDGYLNVKRLPDEYSSLRQTFDTRANNRVRDIIIKYDTEGNDSQINENNNRNRYGRN
jgi:hypothetical protein